MTTKNIIGNSRISKMARNITNIKKLIYDTLVGDTTLIGLIGSSNNIYHQFPPVKVTYPIVVYSIISDDVFPYEETRSTSQFTKTTFGLEIYSDSSATSESDNIEDRVFQIFNGKSFSNDVLTAPYTERSYYTQFYDTDSKLWRTVTRYQMVSSPK